MSINYLEEKNEKKRKDKQSIREDNNVKCHKISKFYNTYITQHTNLISISRKLSRCSFQISSHTFHFMWSTCHTQVTKPVTDRQTERQTASQVIKRTHSSWNPITKTVFIYHIICQNIKIIINQRKREREKRKKYPSKIRFKKKWLDH